MEEKIGSPALVDISEDLDIKKSESQQYMSVDEILSQYPKLTKVSRITDFNVTKLRKKLENVKGQQDNVEVILDAVEVWGKRAKKDRPLVLMFAGTSGTGKTYTAQQIQDSLSENGYKFVRINMNEYSSEADSWKFLGSSTGYSGSTDDPPIFAARKTSDKLVILFDEIEKAHPRLFTTIMGLMDEGMLSNGRGEQFDFRQCIIIFTTNLAMDRLIVKKRELVGNNISITDQKFQDEVRQILKEAGIRNEICGRIEYVLVYNTFNKKEVAQITLEQIRKKGLEYEIRINRVPQSYLDQIASQCADNNEGARPIKRLVENTIEPVLQDAYSSEQMDAERYYDFNEQLELVPSVENSLSSLDSFYHESNEQSTSEVEEEQISQIEINTEPYFANGYNYDDYRKAMGLLILDDGEAYGSALLISSDGYIMTCEHCTDAQKIIFKKDDDKIEYSASVVYKNKDYDIAILKIDVVDMPYLQITNSMRPLKVGSEIVILGYPEGKGINEDVSAFPGTISSIDKNPQRKAYQTGAIAMHGSSGGAFVSKNDGVVYGLLMAGFKDSPINMATDIRNLLSDNDFTINFI